MTSLFATPDPDLEDQQVIGEIHETRASLADYLRVPKRWNGLLRRTSTARAIQGSNTIEGYTVSEEDAVAAVDDEPPLSADEETWLEIIAYRRVLTYVLNVATEPGFVIDAAVLRSMHFMLLDHDLSKTPGRYRTSEIFVRDDKRGVNVYAGPEGELVPELMRALSESLSNPTSDDPLVRGAMAHLNLVMIHPFRDGNGRMARALRRWSSPKTKSLNRPSPASRSGSETTPRTTTTSSRPPVGRMESRQRRNPLGEVQPAGPPYAGPDDAPPVRRGRDPVATDR